MVVIERWVAAMTTETCQRCADLHGTLWQQDYGPRPPLHPYCRCKRVFDHFRDAPPPGDPSEPVPEE